MQLVFIGLIPSLVEPEEIGLKGKYVEPFFFVQVPDQPCFGQEGRCIAMVLLTEHHDTGITNGIAEVFQVCVVG